MYSSWKLCIGKRKAWSMSEAILRHSGSVNSVVLSHDGRHIVSASDDTTTKIWNMATGECEVELKHPQWVRVNTAVFSPDDMYVVSSSDDWTVWILEYCHRRVQGSVKRAYRQCCFWYLLF